MKEISLGGFQDKDDTLHLYDNRDQDYYEWWYFDARFDKAAYPDGAIIYLYAGW
jgi:hypothetical protein